MESLLVEEFKKQVGELNQSRRNLQNGVELKQAIEAIIIRPEYQKDPTIQRMRDYIRLWTEYSQLVQDFERVLAFAISELGMTDYTLFLTLAIDIEHYKRDFKKSN